MPVRRSPANRWDAPDVSELDAIRIERAGADTLISVHLQPGARADAICGVHGDALKCRVRARPQRGRANEALLKLLADALSRPQRSLEIVSGHGARRKRIRLRDMDPETVRTRLRTLLEP